MKKNNLEQLKRSVSENLFECIIPFWLEHSVDNRRGGFFGRIRCDLSKDINAPKSLILISRILWTFSALYKFKPDEKYLEIARRAYHYLTDYLIDTQYGGAYWLLDANGLVIDNMKKMYGQAFLIYSLSEYYSVARDEEIIGHAIRTFELIEKHNYDPEFGGYFEVSNRDWSVAEDMRLSAVDMNEKKSMNTHLHLLEAYTNLYRYWQDDLLKVRLKNLIEDFLEHIIDRETYHFKLFFNECWQPKSAGVSFGHDIEGSWLLDEAARVIGDEESVDRIGNVSRRMVDAIIAEAVNEDGALYLERNSDCKIVKDPIYWWAQAEAVVGFFYIYQLTKERKYLDFVHKIWGFIDNYLTDRQYGEWYYEVFADGRPNLDRWKVSEWKGPYHNCRACLEILKRVDAIRKEK